MIGYLKSTLQCWLDALLFLLFNLSGKLGNETRTLSVMLFSVCACLSCVSVFTVYHACVCVCMYV